MKKPIPLVRFAERIDPGFEITRISRILDRSYPEHNPTEAHKIEFFALLYIDTGTGSHEIDFEEHPVKKGDLVLVAKGQTQRFRKKANFDGHLLLFTEDFLYRKASLSSSVLLNLIFPICDALPIIPTDGRTRRSLGILFEEWSGTDEFERAEILRTLLDYLLLQISRLRNVQIAGPGQSQYQHVFSKFFALVQNHHRVSRNAKDYANMLDISYKHLNTICKNMCNRSAKQAIDEYLVIEIKRALATAPESIDDLSIFFGFDETTNFVKYFKRHGRMTPAQFRRGLRNRPVRD